MTSIEIVLKLWVCNEFEKTCRFAKIFDGISKKYCNTVFQSRRPSCPSLHQSFPHNYSSAMWTSLTSSELSSSRRTSVNIIEINPTYSDGNIHPHLLVISLFLLLLQLLEFIRGPLRSRLFFQYIVHYISRKLYLYVNCSNTHRVNVAHSSFSH